MPVSEAVASFEAVAASSLTPSTPLLLLLSPIHSQEVGADPQER